MLSHGRVLLSHFRRYLVHLELRSLTTFNSLRGTVLPCVRSDERFSETANHFPDGECGSQKPQRIFPIGKTSCGNRLASGRSGKWFAVPVCDVPHRPNASRKPFSIFPIGKIPRGFRKSFSPSGKLQTETVWTRSRRPTM